ncbi:fatty acid CoA ligase family protein [Legionella brunensis]|uniref:Acyl-CoA synthetase n=1 Tax=Legionella brunensis TaxID=29422 RepID=A0A0W0SM65_9GAMM|nr:fatty acid CoA ligase family protein [Legionella brunensis]KTC84037.1 acyl-CoA synthetase [Legionella brunensis]
MSEPSPIVNISGFLSILAQRKPDKVALYVQTKTGQYLSYTYQELNQASHWIAKGLLIHGLKPKDRVVLMVKPGLMFFSLVFGLFKAGIVPVIIDPGLEKAKLKHALDQVEPIGFIGIPLAQIARILLKWGKKSIQQIITVGPRLFWGGTTLEQICQQGKETQSPLDLPVTHGNDIAAILFTSGSTGIPKGAVYKHSNFLAQVELIKKSFQIQPGEVDVPTFPLFALFDPALEMTSVIPNMDFSKPAKANPDTIIQLVHEFNATNLFASPALLDRLSRYAATKKLKMPTLKRTISAGAALHPKIVQQFKDTLNPNSELFTAYGATESLPVSLMGGNDILQDTQIKTHQGFGICVGKTVPPSDVKIIQIDDRPLREWNKQFVLPPGEIGEIVVRGPQVTESYFQMERETLLAKIPIDNHRDFYHRMGDVGYFDESGRLWYCGRKSQRVITKDQTYFTEVCEGIFNQHPMVFRSALVGVHVQGSIVPVICIELESNTKARFTSIQLELRQLAQKFPQTQRISYFLHHKKLPVDIRHNAKIIREQVAKWAAKEINK